MNDESLRAKITQLRKERDAHQMDESDYVDSVVNLFNELLGNAQEQAFRAGEERDKSRDQQIALAARREAIAELRQSQIRCAEYEKEYGFDSKEAYRRWHDEGWHGTDVSDWMMDYFGVWEHEKFIELSGRKEELSSVQLDYGQFQAQTFINGQAMTVAERYDELERELATLKENKQ